MSASYISSYMLSATLRSSIMGNQSALSRATKEATTGRFADVGLELGPSTGRDVSLRAEMSFMSQIVDTNELVAGRLDVTQNRIGQLGKTAQEFLKNLIAARDADSGARIILPSASANLQDLIASLDASYNGAYLFGGLNTLNTPIVAYAPGSSSKNAVDAAFVAAFGFGQGAAGVSGITPAQMQNFLNTNLDPEFANGAWNTNWSTATDQVLSSRISTTEVADASVSANEPGFRKLAEAYTMLSDLGTTNMRTDTFQVLVDKAISLVSSAINDLAVLGGGVGSIQERVSAASEKLRIQGDILAQQVVTMEKVDPTESSVRINTLQTQIETALALTARLQKISLINYL